VPVRLLTYKCGTPTVAGGNSSSTMELAL